MARDYTRLIQNVKNRTNPDLLNESVLMDKVFSDEIRGLADKKVLEYIKRTMRGVEARYTERTIEAGNMIKQHLKKNNPNLDYKFQGSVPSNTHIVGYSDIDLVQIINSFYYHEGKSNFTDKYTTEYLLNESQKSRLLEVINGSTYLGDTNAELRKIRTDAETVLKTNYKYVDVSKPKSIEVKPTNPDRTVDVVTASWYKTTDSVITNDDERKGIQIYDKKKDVLLSVDFPFLKIKLLNEKDKEVSGRLKKMIRFLKNLKADSDFELKELSSFDISSICYNIPAIKYQDRIYFELVFVLFNEFIKIIEDQNYRDSIMSIDGTEPIFKGKEEKVKALGLLLKDLLTVNQDLVAQTPIVKYL